MLITISMDVRDGVYIIRLHALLPYPLGSEDGIRAVLGCPTRSISSLFPCGGPEPHFPGVLGSGPGLLEGSPA